MIKTDLQSYRAELKAKQEKQKEKEQLLQEASSSVGKHFQNLLSAIDSLADKDPFFFKLKKKSSEIVNVVTESGRFYVQISLDDTTVSASFTGGRVSRLEQFEFKAIPVKGHANACEMTWIDKRDNKTDFTEDELALSILVELHRYSS